MNKKKSSQPLRHLLARVFKIPSLTIKEMPAKSVCLTQINPHTVDDYTNLLSKEDRMLVARIKIMLSMSETEFTEFIVPVLQRFIDYTYFLPASQMHHHAYQGGLLTHSLEVSLYMLILAEDEINVSEGAPEKRKRLEQKWKVMLLLAGLSHDFGKIFTDIVVSLQKSDKVWNPFRDSFSAWCSDHALNEVNIEWNKGRFKTHETFCAFSCYFLLTPALIAWLGEFGHEILGMLFKGIALEDKQNKLTQWILLADQNSVENNFKAHSFLQDPLKSPDKNRLLSVIEQMFKTLIIDGIWFANQKGARLWWETQNNSDHLYLVWGNASKELIEILAKQYSVFNYDEDSLLNVLCQSGVFKAEHLNAPFIKISPECLWQGSKKIYLSMIEITHAKELITCLSEYSELKPMHLLKWTEKEDDITSKGINEGFLDNQASNSFLSSLPCREDNPIEELDRLLNNELNNKLNNELHSELKSESHKELTNKTKDRKILNSKPIVEASLEQLSPPQAYDNPSEKKNGQGGTLFERSVTNYLDKEDDRRLKNSHSNPLKKSNNQTQFTQIILILLTEFQEFIQTDELAIYLALNELRIAYQTKGYDDTILVKMLLNHKKCELTAEGKITIKMTQKERLALFHGSFEKD